MEKTEKQDGLDHLKAARALLTRSCLVTFNGNLIEARSQDEFEADHPQKMDPEYGRLMCWILFAVGSEYLIKGVLMAKYTGVRTVMVIQATGEVKYPNLDPALTKVQGLKLMFTPANGSPTNIGQFLKTTLKIIRDRDVHYYAQDKRKQDHSKVPDIAAALSSLLSLTTAPGPHTSQSPDPASESSSHGQ